MIFVYLLNKGLTNCEIINVVKKIIPEIAINCNIVLKFNWFIL